MAIPSRVRSIQVVNLFSQRRFLLQWQPNPEVDINHYNIYRSENQFTGFTKQGQIDVLSTQFVDTVPFTFGVTHFWKVTAVNTTDQESDLNASEALSDVTIGRFDEEPFKQITLQKADLVFNKVPTGTKNGVNTLFALDESFKAGSTQVYLNGILQIITVDYTEGVNLNSITFVSIIPISTDDLRMNYVKNFS